MPCAFLYAIWAFTLSLIRGKEMGVDKSGRTKVQTMQRVRESELVE